MGMRHPPRFTARTTGWKVAGKERSRAGDRIDAAPRNMGGYSVIVPEWRGKLKELPKEASNDHHEVVPVAKPI